MTITACFITRNHEGSLEQAIRSVAGLATDVVVADTGSTDRTAEVAESAGARVCRIEWARDFAAACNAALDQAAGDWVLLLNPDEELDPGGREALAAVAADPNAFAARVRVQHELRPDRKGFGTAEWDLRLFRKHPAVRYQGRLHPRFVPPLEELAASLGQGVVTASATIRKYAFLSTPTPEKVRWIVRLLEEELRDRPGQLGFQIELGRNLLFLNDPRGHEVLGEAATRVRAFRDAPAPPDPMVGQLLEYLLAVSPQQSRSPIGRDEARDLAVKWFANTPPLLWAVAAERFAAGDYPAAAGLLEQLVGMGRTGQYDPAGGFAPDIIGQAAMMNLGQCYLRLGRWDEAKACFSELVMDPQYRDAALQGYGSCERREPPQSGGLPGT